MPTSQKFSQANKPKSRTDRHYLCLPVSHEWVDTCGGVCLA
jgi:hypothetical protein